MFGDERMQRALLETRGQALASGLESLIGQVVAWHGSDDLDDDIAVLALELKDATDDQGRARTRGHMPRGRCSGAH